MLNIMYPTKESTRLHTVKTVGIKLLSVHSKLWCELFTY